MKTWFITGASSGLGRSFAEAALSRGDEVAVASIDPENMQDYSKRFGDLAYVQHLDVTNRGMVEDVFADAISHFGKIDICVNNAGFVQIGCLEEMSEIEARRQIDVNFFGTFFVSQQAARHMREHRSGTIVQMASLAAEDVLSGNCMYGASKWAVEGMSGALYHEMREFGVRVILLEPGNIKTGIAKSARFSKSIPAYDDVIKAVRERWTKGDNSEDIGDPDKCAQVLLKLVDSENPPKRMVLTTQAYEIVRSVLSARLEELDAWKDFSAMADII